MPWATWCSSCPHSCLCLCLQKLYILGGDIAESAHKCTHLIASKVTRTVKFLTAVSVVRHIVTPEWLDESLKCQKFIGEQRRRLSFRAFAPMKADLSPLHLQCQRLRRAHSLASALTGAWKWTC